LKADLRPDFLVLVVESVLARALACRALKVDLRQDFLVVVVALASAPALVYRVS
jgi:hypothetical protein